MLFNFKERELRTFRESLKHELKLLKHEIDLLPKEKRKDAYKERKDKLDIEHLDKVCCIVIEQYFFHLYFDIFCLQHLLKNIHSSGRY